MSGCVCGVCDRSIQPDDTSCNGCARDASRARVRAELEAYRRRLQPAVLTNARNHAWWALASAVESLGVALEAATDDHTPPLHRARELARAAQQQLRRKQ